MWCTYMDTKVIRILFQALESMQDMSGVSPDISHASVSRSWTSLRWDQHIDSEGQSTAKTCYERGSRVPPAYVMVVSRSHKVINGCHASMLLKWKLMAHHLAIYSTGHPRSFWMAFVPSDGHIWGSIGMVHLMTCHNRPLMCWSNAIKLWKLWAHPICCLHLCSRFISDFGVVQSLAKAIKLLLTERTNTAGNIND